MTVGEELISLQLSISPPTPAITASMSAAVVPVAKLLATTTYGTAMPLMCMFSPFPFLRTLTLLSSSSLDSSDWRLEYARLPRSSLDDDCERGNGENRPGRGLAV